MSFLIPYASRTGTRRNLDALRERGWRLLVSATGALRHEGFRYCFDNGAWTAHQDDEPFDGDLFDRGLVKMGPGADFTIVPDIVGGGRESLAFSMQWLQRVLDHSPMALVPVQDGMELGDVEHLLGPRIGIFVGGRADTDFKERTAAMWAAACRKVGAWCHVGRFPGDQRKFRRPGVKKREHRAPDRHLRRRRRAFDRRHVRDAVREDDAALEPIRRAGFARARHVRQRRPMTRIATIAKRFTFDAAHRLERLPVTHPCHRLHGHTYEVELVLLGPIDDFTGFIVDYDEIRRAWEEVGEAKLDHRFLNEVPGLEVSSTENLVYWLVRELAKHPALVRNTMTGPTTLLRAVRVKESSTTWCEIDVHFEASGIEPWSFSDEAMALLRSGRIDRA